MLKYLMGVNAVLKSVISVEQVFTTAKTGEFVLFSLTETFRVIRGCCNVNNS